MITCFRMFPGHLCFTALPGCHVDVIYIKKRDTLLLAHAIQGVFTKRECKGDNELWVRLKLKGSGNDAGINVLTVVSHF